MNGGLNKLECFICKKPFYSFRGENLNIKEWYNQQNKLFNLKGRKAIFKCKEGYYGHVFKNLSSGSTNSNEISKLADQLYFVFD